LLLSGIGSLLLEIRRFEDLWSFENRSFDGVGSEIDFKAPLLDFLGVGDHGIEVADGLDAVMGLLEETLAHGGHDLLVFSDTLGDTDEGTEFWGQIDVLALLFNFKKRLCEIYDLNVVLLLEIQNHGNGLADFSLFKFTSLRSHIPLDGGYFVRLVLSIPGHHDGTLELFINGLADLLLVWGLPHEALTFFFESMNLLLNELETVVN